MAIQIAIITLLSGSVFAQNVNTVELIDAEDIKELIEEDGASQNAEAENKLNLSTEEELDDLQSLKQDIGEIILDDPVSTMDQEGSQKKQISTEKKKTSKNKEVVNEKTFVEIKEKIKEGVPLFDAGEEEKQLLELSKFVEMKIPYREWSEITKNSKLDKYVVQEGDWLWKISKALFGTGFYYSKIWSLNPQIKNPHEIEPGMTLVFDSGSEDDLPQVQVGTFEDLSDQKDRKLFAYDKFGEGVRPNWMQERQKLIEQGVFFQYASDETYEDLSKAGKELLVTEYKKYDPPTVDLNFAPPEEEYDSTGFDKSSRVVFNFKEGFFLNTFITTNVVQDLGEIAAYSSESVFIQKGDKIYVKLDEAVKAKPGDRFSIYTPKGKVMHSVSDRAGYEYTISGQIEVLKRINKLWECRILDLSGIVQRGDRITIYTPRIEKIFKVFTKRRIEAAIISTFENTSNGISFGDVVYLDRGREDGVELGTIFEIYSFMDRGTGKQITPDPTYKIGELTVITLTDNFSTAIVSLSSQPISVGSIAMTKSPEDAAKSLRSKMAKKGDSVDILKDKALEELDVELRLDDIGKSLLDEADSVKLTEDELEELERQEREKSIIKDHEKDLKELERLEKEILTAEAKLKEAKIDEDRFLEDSNLDDLEKELGKKADSFEDLDEIESEIGVKYLDESLDSKENPYGLTEFDLEQINILLNSEEM